MKWLAIWKGAYAVAVAAVAIATPLIYTPPGHSLEGSALNWKLLATIAVAAAFLARLIPSSSRVAIFGPFILGVVLLIIYFYLSQVWSCEVGPGRVVIGSVLKSEAATVLATSPSATCTDLLLNFASDPRRVYEESAIYLRETVLGALYFVMIVLFSAGLLGLTRGTNPSTP